MYTVTVHTVYYFGIIIIYYLCIITVLLLNIIYVSGNCNCIRLTSAAREAGVSRQHGALIDDPPETPQTITALSYCGV